MLVALLVPAATLTAVRLLDLDSGLAIRLVSFTPLALPLYVAAVLLLAVLVVVRGGCVVVLDDPLTGSICERRKMSASEIVPAFA